MTQKRKRQYSDILNQIDYYFKQADGLSSVGDLDDLITAASSTFYFKDVSARTISMFNVSGDITQHYLSLQMPKRVTAWDSGPEALESGAFTEEQHKTVEQFKDLTNKLFPDGTETGSDTTEAGNAIADAIASDDFDYSKDDIFPKQGILLHDDQAGAMRIQRVDPKDSSKGYNVYRNNASVEGGNYSKVAPWADNERTQLNDLPISHYKDAYRTIKDIMVAGGMDRGKKPQVRLGLGAQLSRQQRRNLVSKLEKKLESREKAIKRGIQSETRKNWKNNSNYLLGNLIHEQSRLGLKDEDQDDFANVIALGQKAQKAGYREYTLLDRGHDRQGNALTPKVKAFLRRERTKAEEKFFYAHNILAAEQQFASEKKSLVTGVLQQSKVKGSPVWNAAVKPGGQLTDKAMHEAGAWAAKVHEAPGAATRFLGRMKAAFKYGWGEEQDRQRRARPSGELYEKNPQGYWEERSKLATKYGIANAEFDRETNNANKLENTEKSYEAKKAAFAKFSTARDRIGEDAEKMGSNIENIQDQVQKIKSGSITVLPPAAGWPSAYGGASKVKSLQRNLKIAGLKPYAIATTGIPQDTAPPDAFHGPWVPFRGAEGASAEAAPAAEAGAPADGQQLALDPAAMAGGGQPQAGAAPEAAQVPVQPEVEQPYLPGMAPGAAPGATQQVPMPGMGAEEGAQPVAGGPGSQISGKQSGSGGAGAQVPAREREYSTSAPYGLPLYHGEERGEGKISSFYDKRAARQSKAAMAEKTGLVVPGVGASANQPGYGQAVGALQEQGRAIVAAGENEMAEPMDDYKQAADEEEAKAKRSQSKSKIRTARANARMAKARANEAEAKASRSESESGAKIAHMLEKLDREIIELTAYANPKVSSVLSRLEKAIDGKHKVPATKK